MKLLFPLCLFIASVANAQNCKVTEQYGITTPGGGEIRTFRIERKKTGSTSPILEQAFEYRAVVNVNYYDELEQRISTKQYTAEAIKLPGGFNISGGIVPALNDTFPGLILEYARPDFSQDVSVPVRSVSPRYHELLQPSPGSNINTSTSATISTACCDEIVNVSCQF